MKQQAAHLAWGSGKELINFYIPAVASMSLEEWLAMAEQQYLLHLQPEERGQALTDVYNQCTQSIAADAQEDANPGKKQKNTTRKGSDTNSEAPVNP